MRAFFLFIILFFPTACYLAAQNSGYIDPRLYDYYEVDYLENLSQASPKELHYLNWYLDNSYVIKEVGIEKCEGLPYLQYVDIKTNNPREQVVGIDENDFNIYHYYTERKYNRSVTYRIGDSGKILILRSDETLVKNYNKHMGYEN